MNEYSTTNDGGMVMIQESELEYKKEKKKSSGKKQERNMKISVDQSKERLSLHKGH